MIDKYGEEFKAIVLKHLQEECSEAEWARLRALKDRQSPFEHETAERERRAVVTREQLVQAALTDEGIPLGEFRSTFNNKEIEIDKLDGEPVYYFKNKGIYAWAPSNNANCHLSIWVTHPAYPPGW